jgi:hypothetical protein
MQHCHETSADYQTGLRLAVKLTDYCLAADQFIKSGLKFKQEMKGVMEPSKGLHKDTLQAKQ